MFNMSKQYSNYDIGTYNYYCTNKTIIITNIFIIKDLSTSTFIFENDK